YRVERVNVRDDAVDLLRIVTQFLERGFDRLIDDFEHSATGEQLVFYQRDVRLDSSGIAIHQETDCPCRREYGDLRIAITVARSQFRCAVPNFRGFLFQMRELF